MKITLDEKVKHRLVGVAVIISLIVIFLPALIKRSGQNLNEPIRVSVHLPPKPIPPEVQVPDDKQLFNEVKTAKVSMPVIEQPTPQNVTVMAKAKPIQRLNSEVVAKKSESPKGASSRYLVQLASFSNQVNAKNLVSQLNGKGFPAKFDTYKSIHGARYRVLVGRPAERDKAQALQMQLTKATQLNGIIVSQNIG